MEAENEIIPMTSIDDQAQKTSHRCNYCGAYDGPAHKTTCRPFTEQTEPKPDAPAREWALPLTTLIVNSDLNRPDGIHVIEKSAYDALKESLDLQTGYIDSVLKSSKAERDALKQRVAEAERQLDNCWEDRGAHWKNEFDKATGQLATAQARIAELEQDHKDDMREYGTMLDEIAAAKAESLAQLQLIDGMDKELEKAQAEIERLNNLQPNAIRPMLEQKLTQANARIAELGAESAANFKSAESWKEQALEKFELIDAIEDAKEREQKLVAALNSIWSIANAQGFTVIRSICDEGLKAHKGGA